MRVQCSMFHSLAGTTSGLYIDMEGALHVWLLCGSAELCLYLDICFGTKGCYGPHRPISDTSRSGQKWAGYYISRVSHARRTPESPVRNKYTYRAHHGAALNTPADDATTIVLLMSAIREYYAYIVVSECMAPTTRKTWIPLKSKGCMCVVG